MKTASKNGRGGKGIRSAPIILIGNSDKNIACNLKYLGVLKKRIRPMVFKAGAARARASGAAENISEKNANN